MKFSKELQTRNKENDNSGGKPGNQQLMQIIFSLINYDLFPYVHLHAHNHARACYIYARTQSTTHACIITTGFIQ